MPADLPAAQFPAIPPERDALTSPALANPFAPADLELILRARGWLRDVVSPEMDLWLRNAAALLGPQAVERSALFSEAPIVLAALLELIFVYDAQAILSDPENQTVMSREGARNVIRELANRVLAVSEINSDRFKEIIEGMKSALGFHGRKLFHPIRLALAGRPGDGELDRVILLLDAASRLPFVIPVKGTRQRMIEFCAALD